MTINIDCINESTVISDADVEAMLPALTSQWNNDLVPIWGVDPLSPISFVPKTMKPALGHWWLVFLDDSDQAGALAYHDLTNDGAPISKVFVKTLQQDGASVSVGASHELLEMAVDPWLNGAFQDNNGIFWAGEIADPVEDDSYGYHVGTVLVSDFVTPDWFGIAGTKIDFGGHASAPFQILSGGYAQNFDPSAKQWQQITGARAMLSRHATPAPGSRRDRRARGWRNWRRSERVFSG